MKAKALLLSLIATLGISLCSCSFTDSLKGEQGEQGEKGEKGNDGASLLSGAGTPNDAYGNDGDSYIDTSNFDYYVKADGAWVKKGNIKGKDGSSFLSGSGSPNDAYGNDGDSYLDYSNFDYYLKTNGTWIKVGNTKGDSSYETYLKEHPEYTGDEEAWINDLSKGDISYCLRLATFEGNQLTHYFD